MLISDTPPRCLNLGGMLIVFAFAPNLSHRSAVAEICNRAEVFLVISKTSALSGQVFRLFFWNSAFQLKKGALPCSLFITWNRVLVVA